MMFFRKILFVITLLWAIQYTNAQCGGTPNVWNDSWTSCELMTSPNAVRGNSHWLLYEFREAKVIDSIHIWNANKEGESILGVQDLVVDYSVDGESWIELGEYEVPQADESETYEGFDEVALGNVLVQKILFTVLTNHNDANNDCVSIAEVQFQVGELEDQEVPVTGINISPENVSLQVGETEQLTSEVLPENADNQNVSWLSSDENIATVDSNGLITAISLGEVTISVITEDGNFEAESMVTVLEEVISVTGINVSPESTELEVGETEQLIIEILPSDASNQNVSWISSDESIAIVNANGLVTAVSGGDAMITVSTDDGDFQAQSMVTVEPEVVMVTGVNISPENVSLQVGETEQLTLEVLPVNADNQNVSWISSDENIATVDSNGLITAVSLGEVTISVITEDGNFEAQSMVTVLEEVISVTGINVSPESMAIEVGETEQLIIEILPSDASNQNVSWISSDESIATVDPNGLVTAVSGGDAMITVSTDDGDYVAQSIVVVAQELISVTGIDILTESDLSLEVGEIYELTAQVLPVGASNQNMNWVSSDESIVMVNSQGMVTAMEEGEVIVTVTSESGDFNDSIIISVLGEDVEIDEENTSVIIYPNPFTDQITINSLENVSIEVYDIAGKLLLNKVITEDEDTVDMSNLSEGIYYIITTSMGKTAIHKIIKI